MRMNIIYSYTAFNLDRITEWDIQYVMAEGYFGVNVLVYYIFHAVLALIGMCVT